MDHGEFETQDGNVIVLKKNSQVSCSPKMLYTIPPTGTPPQLGVCSMTVEHVLLTRLQFAADCIHYSISLMSILWWKLLTFEVATIIIVRIIVIIYIRTEFVTI